jgi:butyryl-CoA dehydrogenase
MASKFVSMRNLKFVLYELLQVESLTDYPYFKEHGRETFDMVMDTALKMSTELLFPVFQEMDKKPPEYKDGIVHVHPVVRECMNAAGEGGWISAIWPYEKGGQQLPFSVFTACSFIFYSANYSLAVYPFLNAGSAHLIESFGSEELKETFLPNMMAGKWQGTMALTEPDAGSSLSDITTTAVPEADGSYRIRGQKIFISAGSHDCAENVVHLMLARIKGSPAGVKGISLFVVPAKRPGKDGTLVPNDLTCAGIYHKLGYRGAPITQLSIGDDNECRGYLVGEANRGLSYMFQMMNEARIDVGLGAAGIATAAYYAALEYTRERPQGRRITEKDPTKPQIPIIEHADVKRMLLFQKAVNEGALSIIMQLSMYTDLAMVSTGEDKERYELLVDLLTPIAKTYPSEMGILAVSQGLQCLGGYGYCDEFPLEQYYRDARIHPIHEGTTGIQGMDLLGRKVVMKNGKAFKLFLEEVRKDIAAANGVADLRSGAADLDAALKKLEEVITHLAGIAMKGEIEVFLADATLFLELFGIIAVAWQWLKQAMVAEKALGGKPAEADANFYQGKLYSYRYFIGYELPKIEGLAQRLKNSDGLTVSMKAGYFED